MATYLFDNNKNLVDVDSSGDKYGFDEVKNRLLFSYQEGVYGVDEYKNMVEVEINVGDTVVLDGIECLCIYDNPYLFVDKNHDLSYYLEGDDFVNVLMYWNTGVGEGTKYGYEWGAFDSFTNIQNTNIGVGLGNTNALISMNLQPENEDWPTVWQKVNIFRQSYSHNWFVPSKDELNLIYQQKSNLTNISDITSSGYWASCEDPELSGSAWGQYFDSGKQDTIIKSRHLARVRLCRTL